MFSRFCWSECSVNNLILKENQIVQLNRKLVQKPWADPIE